MGRKAALLALAAMCATAVAQVSGQPQAAPRAALTELGSLRTMQALQISQEQAGDILKALADVSKRQQDYAVWAAGQANAAASIVQAAAASFSRRQLPSAPVVAQAKTVLSARMQQIQGIQQAAEAAAEQVIKIGDLSTEVESKDASNAIADMQARFDGATSPAEYIVDEAEALRLLDNRDYRLMRLVESRRIAGRIVGGRGGAATQLAGGVLNALDSLRALPDRDFDTGRAALIQQVSANLNVAGPQPGAPLLSWPAFVDWLTVPETAKPMAEVSGQTAPTVTQVSEDVDGSLSDLRMLLLFVDLQLGPEQAASLGQLLAAVGVDKNSVEGRLDQAAQGADTALPKLVAAVKGGQAAPGDVADAVQAALEASDAARGVLRASMSMHITSFRRILTPAQRALVDWTPTGAVERMAPEDRAAMLRQQAGIIAEGLDALNTTKFAQGTRYKTAIVTAVRPLVARYIDPRRPDFPDAYNFAIGIVSDARFVSVDDWNSGADVDYATRLMQGLGALEEEPGTPSPNAIYGWGDIYDILLGAAGTPLATAFGG